MRIKKIIARDLAGNDISGNVTFDYSELNGATVCSVCVKAEGGLRGDEAFVLVPDVQPLGEYLAIENHSPFWCRPAFGKDCTNIPERTQELLVKKEDGYFCLLPLCGDYLKALVRQGEEGIELWAYSNIDGVCECRQPIYVCAEGEDAHALLDLVASVAAKLLGIKLRGERAMPEMFKYFGWCSWDAFQFRVNHEGLLVKAREFREKGVPVGFAILDDMWADVPSLEVLPDDIDFKSLVKVMHYSKLKELDGSPRRFPKGMKAAVADLKEYIPNVGIWFPTTGYWYGFDENGEDFAKHKELMVHIPPENGNGFRFTVGKQLNIDHSEGKWLVKPDSNSADKLFDDLCDRIESWGCNFVKVDNQGCHTHYKGIAPIGVGAKAMQSAIDKAAFKHFDGALINCMGMPSECMFNRPDSAISRCSDDFQPESRAWFSKNILQCAYNGVHQGQFYINDWDMWWTDDEQAVKNSVCRSISGGPVYVSDKVGRTRPEVLSPICFADGRVSVCDYSAKPTADCLVSNPTEGSSPLKIFNRLGESGVIAAYNVTASNVAVKGSLRPSDAGMDNCDVAYFEYFSRECGVIKAGESLEFELCNNDEFKLYTLVPIKDGRAVFGRIDKYVSRGALLGENDGRFTLYEGGEIGIYSERMLKITSEGREVAVSVNGALNSFKLSEEINEFIVE